MTLAQRVDEAASLLGSIPGVTGLILGGSVGRGEPWPLSDVDMIVVYADVAVASAPAELERRRSLIEDFWGWCGVSGSLDLGSLWFTESEASAVVAAGVDGLIARVGEFRWFHAMDKAYGGRVLLSEAPVVMELGELLTEARFTPSLVAARVAQWAAVASSALLAGDAVAAAEAMIDWSTERWGGRCASFGRRWTRYEAYAARRGFADLAARIVACRGAGVADVAARVEVAPWWLRHRIEVALSARQEVGEEVTAAQNARDHLVAFAQLWQRRGLPAQPWTQPVPSRIPDPVATLTALLAS